MLDLILIQILNASIYCKSAFRHCGSFHVVPLLVVKKSRVSIDAIYNFKLKTHGVAGTDIASHGRS